MDTVQVGIYIYSIRTNNLQIFARTYENRPLTVPLRTADDPFTNPLELVLQFSSEKEAAKACLDLEDSRARYVYRSLS